MALVLKSYGPCHSKNDCLCRGNFEIPVWQTSEEQDNILLQYCDTLYYAQSMVHKTKGRLKSAPWWEVICLFYTLEQSYLCLLLFVLPLAKVASHQPWLLGCYQLSNPLAALPQADTWWPFALVTFLDNFSQKHFHTRFRIIKHMRT